MRSFVKLLACFVLLAGAARAKADADRPLKCSSGKIGPFLDFEFRFVAGTWFSLPVKQFWGDRFELGVEIIVEPVNGTPGEPKLIHHELKVDEEVPEGIRGEVGFSSAFSVGSGEYRTTWRIEDDRGRHCNGTRLFKASLGRSERSVKLTLEPGEIVDTAMHLFRPQRRFERPHLKSSRRIKIFISMDVLGRRGRVVRPRPFHVLPHFAALRRLANSPNFNEFSVVAFSFEDQKVLIHQDYRETVDFESMSGVIKELRPETVDFSQLARGSEMQFFASLLSGQLLRSEPPEAVVFLGQDLHFGRRLPDHVLDPLRQIGAVVSFLDASRFAWRGAMGNLVRALGGTEYRLRRPSDLARAIASFEERVLRSRPQ